VSHELRVERLIDAAPGEVFDVFVDADAQKEWYRDPEHPGAFAAFRARDEYLRLETSEHAVERRYRGGR
jgi:uncharacterized protein YndB with AHSA1/START domain